MSKSNRNPILPGSTIGIVGGGQLGQMMAIEAKHLGYRVAVLDPAPHCPAAQVADEHIVAAYTDIEMAQVFAEHCDVATYEFENVNAEVIRTISHRVYLPQGARLLEVSQHRWLEKESLTSMNVPVAPYRPIYDKNDLHTAVEQLGLPIVVKTTTGGYDGKGQWLIKASSELESVWTTIPSVVGGLPSNKDTYPLLIAEAWVPFHKEISVVVGRNFAGELRNFPVAENIHQNHILHMTIVPARIPDAVVQAAFTIARTIAESLGLVGVLAVEMFMTEDGNLLVNELAPRPHNSGHFSQNACVTSQFEQHVRAICNLPLGDVRLLTPVVMVNILGQHLQGATGLLARWPENWKLHLYGKSLAVVNRKMGHVNVLCSDVEVGIRQILQSEIW